MAEVQEKFSYSAQPHAAPIKKRSKYRNENDADFMESNNIMSDPRVVRGSTYAAKMMSQSLKTDLRKAGDPAARKSFKPSAASRTMRSNTNERPPTPPPVHGRAHMDIQTDDFLEELSDRPIEVDVETQTSTLMDRAPQPLFVVAKTGFDVETQILPGDLFDFDLEVKPILEVLVGKTIHVAMLELMQEEELNAIREQQEQFEAIRNVELAEVQRLEAEAQRKLREKQKRMAQEADRLKARKALEEKIAARAFSHQYLSSLHLEVFDNLSSEGFFYDPVRKEVEDILLPGLFTSVSRRVDAYASAQRIAEELIENARSFARKFEAAAQQAREDARAKAAAEAEAERLRLIAEAEAEKARKAAEEAAAAAAEGGAAEEES